MDKYQKAEQLLEEKVKKCEFRDEVNSLVYELFFRCIEEVEIEVEGLHDNDNPDELDGTEWYDFVSEDMLQILYKRIGKWLTE